MPFAYEIERESAASLFEMLEAEYDIVRIVDPVTRKVLFWPAAERDEADAPCPECNAVWGRADRCPNCTSLEALELKRRMFKIELSNNRAYWVQSRPVTLEGEPCVLETVNDVTDGLTVEGSEHGKVVGLIENLNNLIVTDALTSLFNRRFIDDFSHRIAELEQDGTCINVAMIDLDDMKDINDTFGHPAGDAVLKAVGGFLKLNYSTRDEHRERYAVRYGGDEFLVIDVGSDPEAFEADVRDHYRNMRRICYFGDIEFPFSLSLGFSSSDEFGWDWNAMLDAADKRMYADKRTHWARL